MIANLNSDIEQCMQVMHDIEQCMSRMICQLHVWIISSLQHARAGLLKAIDIGMYMQSAHAQAVCFAVQMCS